LAYCVGKVGDLPRRNKHKLLLSRAGFSAINKILLKNPFITCNKIRNKLNLVAKVRTIRGYVKKLGWRKVTTKYCQIVSFDNRVKRFIYCCLCKIYNEKYENVVAIDEDDLDLDEDAGALDEDDVASYDDSATLAVDVAALDVTTGDAG
jgi:hypothetical protein